MADERRYPRRLIEVDFPVREVSRLSAREKDSRMGHIPRLHIYPAARPTGACRAVACASAWPAPEDAACTEGFVVAASHALISFAARATSEQKGVEILGDSWDYWNSLAQTESSTLSRQYLQGAMLAFISAFTSWEAGTEPAFLDAARTITAAAREALRCPSLMIDPFSGGGAIPLESLRIGLDAFASDMNPIAVLICKVVIEFAHRYGPDLIRDIDRWLESLSACYGKELRPFFPSRSEDENPICYIWARCVLSEDPAGGDTPIEVPLLRSMWLARTKRQKVALRWLRDRSGNVVTDERTVTYADGRTLRVRRPRLEIFTPQSAKEVERGSAQRMSATCPVTGYTTSARRVEAQLRERRGGAVDARLCCVVIDLAGHPRSFRLPTAADEAAAAAAAQRLDAILNVENVLLVPDESLHVMSGVFNAPIYGHDTWGSLFSPRQALAHVLAAKHAKQFLEDVAGRDPEYKKALASVVGILLDRLLDLNSALCGWQLNTPNAAHVFTRWALPMMMDFAEINPIAKAGGSPQSAARRIKLALANLASARIRPGTVEMGSALEHPLPDDCADLMFTDPPYYNAVPYADIADFFYVWLRRSIGPFLPEVFAHPETPKDEEICEMAGWDPVRYRHKNRTFFESRMQAALAHGRRVVWPGGIGVVVFAHKTTTGWEAMLQALVDAGWIVTASWPIDTEMGSRLRARNSAVLSSSVHLVCRPRERPDGTLIDDHIGDWRDVLQELPIRVHSWMARLASEGIVGADATFACLGPALEIFSRYSHVEKVNGERVALREYLEQVWTAVTHEALLMIFDEADATGLEEDARLVAMWLWTASGKASVDDDPAVSQEDKVEFDDEQPASKTPLRGGFVLEFDAARKIAQGLGVHLDQLKHVVQIKGDKARLLSVSERIEHLFGRKTAVSPFLGAAKKHVSSLVVLDAAANEQNWEAAEAPSAGETTLDRVHQAMLLFASGRGDALKRFLVEEGAGKQVQFWKLAQALLALYPSGTDEKRWVDGVLARKKSLGFG